jgi:hypothetical protein
MYIIAVLLFHAVGWNKNMFENVALDSDIDGERGHGHQFYFKKQ